MSFFLHVKCSSRANDPLNAGANEDEHSFEFRVS